MDNPKVILTPNGDAIILSTISFVSAVYNTDNSDIRYNRCYFYIYYGPQSHQYEFNYGHAMYKDEPDVLFEKVKTIRDELLKMMNNGNQATAINASINLKKIEKKK